MKKRCRPLVRIRVDFDGYKIAVDISDHGRILKSVLFHDLAVLAPLGIKIEENLFALRLSELHAFGVGIDRKGILRYRGAVDDVAFRRRVATKFYKKDAVEALLAERYPEITEVKPFGCTIVRFI